MTDPEEDKVYNELRRKLADYESPPPPAGWSGVQRQLVARRRPRAVAWLLRPRTALLLVLLGGLIAVLFTQWPLLTSYQATRPGGLEAGPTSTPYPAHIKAPQPATSFPTPPGSDGGGARTAASSAATTAAVGADASNPRSTPVTQAAAQTAIPTSRQPRQPATPPVASAAPLPRLGVRSGAAAMRVEQSANHSAARQTAAADSVQAVAVAAAGEVQTSTSSRNGSKPVATLVLPSAVAIQTLPLATLAARPIVLAQPSLPTAEPPHRVAETPRDSASVRGWVVQALAGPALTYRALGTAPAGSIASLERSALAYSGQLNVGYIFSPRLLLTLGVGYAEYTTRLNLQLQTDTSLLALKSHDTYRLLQVPVQARYWLGQRGALRYGVVGGAAVSLLLGGRTTEGAPCACQQSPIVLNDTTAYRRLGLSVHVGAQAAYRLNARWSVLLQPSFSYFLTPTAQLGAGLLQRRPWGVHLQAGLSLDLP